MVTYKIKDMRRKRGLSQGELSKRSGIARATISKLENGSEVDIRISTILALSKVLKCSPSKLFE